MAYLRAFLVLLLAQLAGEAAHALLHLPLPGPVLGMVLLAAAFLVRRKQPGEALVNTSNTLIAWLGLLFVPAGAGVVESLPLLRSAWLPLTVAFAGATLLTLTVTAATMQFLLIANRKWKRRRP